MRNVPAGPFVDEATRRSFLVAGSAVCGGALLGPAAGAQGAMAGRVSTIRSKRVNVHTYTSPDRGWQVTSQIVELPDQLVVVDGQYLLPYAREAAAYCRTLGKPITRLYISHFHPDHHLGAEAFGAPTYALPEVRAKIIAIGDRLANEERAKFPEEPDVIPAHAIKPQYGVNPGVEIIGGESFDFRVVRHAEADPSLIVALPGHGVLIAQDLIYNHVHLFLGEQNFQGWTAALEDYRAQPFDRILPGHGVPTNRGVYEEMIGYLAFAQKALAGAANGASFAAALIRRYPDYGGRALLEHEQRFLFKAA